MPLTYPLTDRHVRRRHSTMLVATAALTVLALARPLPAQRGGDPSLLTVERIYDPNEFALRGFGPSRWLDDSTYTTIEPGRGREGQRSRAGGRGDRTTRR